MDRQQNISYNIKKISHDEINKDIDFINFYNKEFKTDIFTISYIKINEEQFKNSIFQTKTFEDFNKTPKQIVDILILINNFLINLNDKSKLSPDRDISKKSYIREYQKAKDMKLFLGLDQKLKWTLLIDHDEDNWNNMWNLLFINKKL